MPPAPAAQAAPRPPEPAAAPKPIEEPTFDADLMANDEEQLDLDTGSLSAATQQFSSGLSAVKSSMSHAATVWNGQASELLNLPLSATIVEALTVEQIEGWGAKGNVRMLLGVLNTTMPDTDPSAYASARLQAHRDAALRVILGRGAKSLDALILSLSLSQSWPIVQELDDFVQQPGDPTARGGALAALQMLADLGGPFGRKISPLLTEVRLNKIPSLSPVKIAARERGAAAAVIRVEAVIATHEKHRAEFQANCQRLMGLAENVIQGPDGPAVRIRHISTVSAGFEDLRMTYGTRLGQAADGADLNADLERLRRVTALFDSPELREAMGRLEDLWLTVLQERCAFVVSEASVAAGLSDRINFKGLPAFVASKERLAMLAQAGAELAGMTEELHRETAEIDRQVVGLPETSPLRERLHLNKTAIVCCQNDLQAAADTVVQAIETLEGAIRTDEAMSRKRMAEIEALAQAVNAAVVALLDSPDGHATFQERMAAYQAELAAVVRSFAVIGGAFSRMGGLRMLASVLEGIAALIAALDVTQPGQVEAHSAVTAALARVQSSGMVRQGEIDTTMQLLAAVDRLDSCGAAV